MAQSLNVTNIVSKIGADANVEMQDVANLSKTMDITSPQDMNRMEMAMMKVNMSFQLQSSIVKSIEDTLKSIIQRM